jgi:hypothetical protein
MLSGVCQMSFGERAVLDGVLSQLRPPLAIEIGRAEGGTLERIATHSEEVHSIDPLEPLDVSRKLGNAHLHVGYSHEVLPDLLASFADQGRNVDFALVDGDHSEESVRRDLEMLLSSPALAKTIILAHDTSYEGVRAGFSAVQWEEHPRVVHVDVDFIPGYIFTSGTFRDVLSGGWGLIVVDANRMATPDEPIHQDRYHDVLRLLQVLSDALSRSRDADDPKPGDGAPEIAISMIETVQGLQRDAERRAREAEERRAEAEWRLSQAEELNRSILTSKSWRLTAPLRGAVRWLRSRGDPNGR